MTSQEGIKGVLPPGILWSYKQMINNKMDMLELITKL